MLPNNYSDQFCDWLVEQGYTHCFFVAGGNIMHLLNSARIRFTCVPVVHEVSAAIATEYFNETNSNSKAFALVTAGPGITNAITGIAGAWLESRELLVVGGQVKSEDLKSDDEIRQRGIQEIDGVKILESITKGSLRILTPLSKDAILSFVRKGSEPRKGPVFLEFCLDAQAGKPIEVQPVINKISKQSHAISLWQKRKLRKLINSSQRPVILLGGGVSRICAADNSDWFDSIKIPLFTTWNGADRLGADNPLYFGRPNTWGQRSANVIIQQSDLVIAIGSRLGMQQTGFNRKCFAPLAKVVQVDIDEHEIKKNIDIIELGLQTDAGNFLQELQIAWNSEKRFDSWLEFARTVKKQLPNNENSNSRNSDFINPYDFVEALSNEASSDDVVIPCSSGGAFTTMMQAFNQKLGQRIVTNKGLASMGYGLAGAIGAAYANPGKKVILVEGDGGFAQNLQELGTAKISGLPIKIFLFENNGYASIRMTQENYFNGAYVGCDISTGLGFPDWKSLFNSYDISCREINTPEIFTTEIKREFLDDSVRAFLVKINPAQTYFPKITSKVLENGKMESNPIHKMSPDLPETIASTVFKFINID